MPEVPTRVDVVEIRALMAGESVIEYRIYAIVAGMRRYMDSFGSLAEAQDYASRVTASTERRVATYQNGLEMKY